MIDKVQKRAYVRVKTQGRAGMGEKKYVKVWIDGDVWDRFSAIAKEMKMTQGDMIEMVVNLMEKAENMTAAKYAEEVMREILQKTK